MIQFPYKVKLNERVRAKCSRHPRYNPEKDPIASHAAPWVKYRKPRDPRTRKAITAEDPPRSA
jgi:hypothetical protein